MSSTTATSAADTREVLLGPAPQVCFPCVDVGGARSQRKHWIHSAPRGGLVIFCASLVDYSRPLWEDDSIISMVESIKIFTELRTHFFFGKRPHVILFTKFDLFEAELKRVPLSTAFPEYLGPNETEDCLQYIKALYLASVSREDQVLSLVVSAFDENSMRMVLDKLHNLVLSHRSESLGLH